MSNYAKDYNDATSTMWSRDPDINLLVVKNVENRMNDRLRAEGYVFLNEVYEALGIERSPAGQFVGWSFLVLGDNKIKIDIEDRGDAIFALDFNVDGVIIDKMGKQR